MTSPHTEAPAVPTYWTRIMMCPPITDNIFACLSPASLVRMTRTSKHHSLVVERFMRRAYNINQHLSHFFHNPIGFRSLQARTGTIISGSNAIQFIERTTYPESDLDLYTHPGYATDVADWLMKHENYKFVPKKPSQGQSFDHDRLTNFGDIQANLQWKKGKRFAASDPEHTWTWYVAGAHLYIVTDPCPQVGLLGT